ncbi:hypothetical protein [Burkholderia anthina]|uniref:hypothetical protein n=1 Tax=Burkholderia anthina TaxID=179879 RepID=UPI001589D0FD|nr:hypothetical protein [Burkholderia anthina]
MKITKIFLKDRVRQKSEGLAPVNYRPESVRAPTIISRLIFNDLTPNHQKATSHETPNLRNPIPARTSLTNPPESQPNCTRPQTLVPGQVAPESPPGNRQVSPCFPQEGRHF